MSSPKKEEIINQLKGILKEFLDSELKGENRKPKSNIDCESNTETKITECWVFGETHTDDDSYDVDYETINAWQGYNVPEGVDIPISIFWELDPELDEMKITAQAKWDEIMIKDKERS